MKVDYDSEGHSLLFELGEFGKDDRVEELASGECFVWVLDGKAVSIHLLDADRGIDQLDEVAKRFKLDAIGLRAAAQAALAAPDHEVAIEVDRRRLPSGATKAA